MSFYYSEVSYPKGRTVPISISWNGWFANRPYSLGHDPVDAAFGHKELRATPS